MIVPLQVKSPRKRSFCIGQKNMNWISFRSFERIILNIMCCDCEVNLKCFKAGIFNKVEEYVKMCKL